VREVARDWMTSLVSFTRGHGGGEKANASVGAAFVVGALVVAVLGLRWVSASGPSEESADSTPWDFEEAGEVGPTTTIPASSPAEVVTLADPGSPEGTTVTTQPDQTGIFLPGFPPVAGGTTGTTDGAGTTPPGTDGTTRPNRPGSTRPPSSDSTVPPTSPPTVPETTTTTQDDTTTTTEGDPPLEQLTDQLGTDVNGTLDLLGWPFA
jgi:hypothetical protein